MISAGKGVSIHTTYSLWQFGFCVALNVWMNKALVFGAFWVLELQLRGCGSVLLVPFRPRGNHGRRIWWLWSRAKKKQEFSTPEPQICQSCLVWLKFTLTGWVTLSFTLGLQFLLSQGSGSMRYGQTVIWEL